MKSTFLKPWLLVISFGSLLSVISGFTIASDTFDASYLQSINGADTLTISPKDSAQKYYLYVKLPPNYDKDKKYPAVYLLDGGATFPMLTPIYWQLHFLEDVPDVILVGISYGTNNWREGNNRGHDFTLSSKLSKHWGGAPAFSEFLRNELMPMVESKYSADPKRRVLFGNSLAGHFGLYSATFQADLFYGIIANNPAIHEVTKQFLVKSVSNANEDKLRLFIGQAEHDADRFKEPMQQWLAHWQEKPPGEWQLKVQSMPGHNHFSSIPNVFRAGLKWVLEKE